LPETWVIEIMKGMAVEWNMALPIGDAQVVAYWQRRLLSAGMSHENYHGLLDRFRDTWPGYGRPALNDLVRFVRDETRHANAAQREGSEATLCPQAREIIRRMRERMAAIPNGEGERA
jgi:hypothetical protein